MVNENVIDPWGTVRVKDYNRLLETFGIKPFSTVLGKLKGAGIQPHIYMKRGILFGHRDLDIIIDEFKKGKRIAVLTGFMPSGKFHFGHKLTAEQLIYYQNLGFKVFVALADAEAFAVRKIERKQAIKTGIEEYVANLIALGLDPDKTDFYFQTSRGTSYYRLIQLFSGKVTAAEMSAIYGDLSPAKIVSALTQAADILHVQLDDYGGYDYVIVPVGADQDPHLRLTRDLADRVKGIVNLTRPASTYHKLIRGLDGAKMSSSRPDYTIFLTDPIDMARKKLMAALTGGRATAEEQRKLGGIPEQCTVYDLYMYHLIKDDEELRRIYEECRSGRLLCGKCKKMAARLLEEFLIDHKEKLDVAKETAYQIVEIPSF